MSGAEPETALKVAEMLAVPGLTAVAVELPPWSRPLCCQSSMSHRP